MVRESRQNFKPGFLSRSSLRNLSAREPVSGSTRRTASSRTTTETSALSLIRAKLVSRCEFHLVSRETPTHETVSTPGPDSRCTAAPPRLRGVPENRRYVGPSSALSHVRTCGLLRLVEEQARDQAFSRNKTSDHAIY